MTPGFYCGTNKRVYPVNYVNVPDVRIYDAWPFVHELNNLKPGRRIFGVFNLDDIPAWDRIPDHMKENC